MQQSPIWNTSLSLKEQRNNTTKADKITKPFKEHYKRFSILKTVSLHSVFSVILTTELTGKEQNSQVTQSIQKHEPLFNI